MNRMTKITSAVTRPVREPWGLIAGMGDTSDGGAATQVSIWSGTARARAARTAGRHSALSGRGIYPALIGTVKKEAGLRGPPIAPPAGDAHAPAGYAGTGAGRRG